MTYGRKDEGKTKYLDTEVAQLRNQLPCQTTQLSPLLQCCCQQRAYLIRAGAAYCIAALQHYPRPLLLHRQWLPAHRLICGSTNLEGWIHEPRPGMNRLGTMWRRCRAQCRRLHVPAPSRTRRATREIFFSPLKKRQMRWTGFWPEGAYRTADREGKQRRRSWRGKARRKHGGTADFFFFNPAMPSASCSEAVQEASGPVQQRHVVFRKEHRDPKLQTD